MRAINVGELEEGEVYLEVPLFRVGKEPDQTTPEVVPRNSFISKVMSKHWLQGDEWDVFSKTMMRSIKREPRADDTIIGGTYFEELSAQEEELGTCREGDTRILNYNSASYVVFRLDDAEKKQMIPVIL